ncbi:MAG: hypothetical protein AAGJ93_16645, partial [Bacteroidota bacterium]
MKQNYLNGLLVVVMLFFFSSALQSQSWGSLTPLFNFFPEGTADFFDEEFAVLSDELLNDDNDGLSVAGFDLVDAGDSLSYYLNEGTIGAADSATVFWDYNQSELENVLDNDDSFPEAAEELTETAIGIENTWYEQNESLNEGIATYQNTLSNVDSEILEAGNDRWDVSQGTWESTFGILADNGHPTSAEDEEGAESLEDLFDNTIFSSILDFEIAYGQEFSDVKFFREAYSARSNLLRIASVPKLNQLIEARWALEGSFFNAPEELSNTSFLSETPTSDILNLNEGLNPFIVNADFAITYAPVLGSLGNGKFRLYSSIGMEAGAYIPAHRAEEAISARIDHTNRVGKTTGFGPQIGAGFVLNYFGTY